MGRRWAKKSSFEPSWVKWQRNRANDVRVLLTSVLYNFNVEKLLFGWMNDAHKKSKPHRSCWIINKLMCDNDNKFDDCKTNVHVYVFYSSMLAWIWNFCYFVQTHFIHCFSIACSTLIHLEKVRLWGSFSLFTNAWMPTVLVS